MPTEPSSDRLTPDEAGEVLRRAGVSAARFDERPTFEQVADRAGLSVPEVRAIVKRLRSLGAAIDAPSGDLEEIRLQAQDLEDLEEDPRALSRVATEFAGVELESGEGRRLPKATKWVLIIAVVVFVAMLLAMVLRTPPPPSIR